MTAFENMFQSGEESKEEYKNVINMLRDINLLITPATEDLARRLTTRLIEAKEVEESDALYMQALFLLKAADFCLTRNLSLTVEEGKFRDVVVIEPLDVQIANLTSLCTCLVKPQCSKIKNDFRSIIVFSGEAERLRKTFDTYEATSLLDGESNETFQTIGTEYGIAEGVTGLWFKMKVKVWYRMAEIIGKSDNLRTFKME